MSGARILSWTHQLSLGAKDYWLVSPLWQIDMESRKQKRNGIDMESKGEMELTWIQREKWNWHEIKGVGVGINTNRGNGIDIK